MFHKDFLLLQQWLVNARYVVFYLEHPFLGRPGDNQFEFLDAKFESDTGKFSFSDDLNMELFKFADIHVSDSYVELRSIQTLRVMWGGKIVELFGTSLRIEK